jgi:hypothetical protein
MEERGDKVLGGVNTDFTTNADQFFPDDYFFSSISRLYEDMNDNTSNSNGSSFVVLFVIIILLVKTVLQFLVLALHLEFLLPYYLRCHVYCLFLFFPVMYYLLLFWLIYVENFLYPTIQRPYSRHFFLLALLRL